MEKDIGMIQDAAEAILFASGEAVSTERIADVLSLDRTTADRMMSLLSDRFNTQHGGIHIAKLGNAWQMCTRSEFAKQVRDALDMRRNMPLTQAALEVLAVVAYNQPVTKAFVEQVRGVDCSGVMGGLVEKGLLEERGRLDLPGKPLLYGTTPDFLRCLGISSLGDLPPVGREEDGLASASEQSEPEPEEEQQ